MTRFLFMGKADATRELNRLRRQWFAKRKGVITLLRETIFQQEAQLLDSDAANKALDADAALQALGSDEVAFGYVTATVTVTDRDSTAADDKQRAVERAIQGRGFVTVAGVAQQRRSVALVAAGSRLRQRSAADRLHAEPRASAAAFRGMGRPGAQRASRRSAADRDANRRRDAVSTRDSRRRCRSHLGRRADRRRQVGVARHPRPAISSLRQFAGLPVRQGLLGARDHPRSARRALRPRTRRLDRVPTAGAHRRGRHACMGRRVGRGLA